MIKQQSQFNYKVIERIISIVDAAKSNLPVDQLAQALDLAPDLLVQTIENWVGKSSSELSHCFCPTFSQDIPRATPHPKNQAVHSHVRTSSGMAKSREAIFYDTIDSPFGPAVITATTQGVCGLGFSAEMGTDATKSDLFSRWANTDLIYSPQELAEPVHTIFCAGQIPALHLIGSPFYLEVWRILLDIPIGHASTYSDIATAAGNPKAVRAVGTAIGKNPISWLIPCHRALRKDGTLGGYHWGLSIKRAMLAYEAMHVRS